MKSAGGRWSIFLASLRVDFASPLNAIIAGDEYCTQRDRMKSNSSRLLGVMSLLTFVVLALVAWLGMAVEQATPVTQLEAAVASMSLGISIDEADKPFTR